MVSQKQHWDYVEQQRLLIFCVDLAVNHTLQEFKKDKNTQKFLKIAMLSSYVCVLSTVFCAIIAGFKGV